MAENTNANRFRLALHGFNREDVVAYIEQLSQAHEEELRQAREQNNKLHRELEEANEALDRVEMNQEVQEELEAARQRITELLTENQNLNDRIQELETALEEAQTRAQEAPEIPEQEQDLAAPIPEIQDVLPVEVAPSKDYTELELAAYRRAELAERVARERAADVYREVSAVFSRANTKIGTGRQDLEQMTKTIQGDVNQLMQVLTNLRSAYDEAEASFGAVNEKNRQLFEGEQ